MNKLTGLCAGLGVVLGGCSAMVAQDSATEMSGPPKVLVIDREFTKPGKDGAVHEKSESAFVNAVVAAKWPTHYFAAKSMSGRPRVLFMFGYPSFEAWEKDNMAQGKNPALAAALDHASVADGDLLAEYDQSVFTFDPDGSLHTRNIAQDRYFEITQYRVKPGHRAEWKQLVKMYHDGFADMPEMNWALFESYYGQDNGGVYLAITAMKSLAEDDANMDAGKKLADKLGLSGMKKLAELTAACVESESTNLFAFKPKMSYPSDDWVKADPFWKTKAAPMAKKPTAPAKP